MLIVRITATLCDVDPEVKRTIEVPADLPLDRMHETLQAAFGWFNAHLYQFCIGEPYQWGAEKWVMPDFADDPEDLPADKTTLAEALEKAGKTGLTYLYDFGDDWEHRLDAAPPIAADPDTAYPRLVAAEGACPPEDIGGAPGYEMFVEAMADPKHPDHEDLMEWYGEPFDPADPGEKALKANVAKLARRWSKKKR